MPHNAMAHKTSYYNNYTAVLRPPGVWVQVCGPQKVARLELDQTLDSHCPIQDSQTGAPLVSSYKRDMKGRCFANSKAKKE